MLFKMIIKVSLASAVVSDHFIITWSYDHIFKFGIVKRIMYIFNLISDQLYKKNINPPPSPLYLTIPRYCFRCVINIPCCIIISSECHIMYVSPDPTAILHALSVWPRWCLVNTVPLSLKMNDEILHNNHVCK